MPPTPNQAAISTGPGWKDKQGKGAEEKASEGKAFWGTNWAGQGQWPRPKSEKATRNAPSTKSTPAQSIRTQSPANTRAQSERENSFGALPGVPEPRDIADRLPSVLTNPYVESDVDRIEEMLAMQSQVRAQCYIIRPSVPTPVKDDAEELVDRQLLLARLMKQILEMEEKHTKALSDIAHTDEEVKEPFCKWYGELADVMAISWDEIKSMDLAMTNIMISRIQALAVRIGEELVELEGVALEESFEANEDLLRMLAHSRVV